MLVKRGEMRLAAGDRAGVMEFSAFQRGSPGYDAAPAMPRRRFLVGHQPRLDVEESARLANAAGALCTTQLSHRGIVSLEQTRNASSTLNPTIRFAERRRKQRRIEPRMTPRERTLAVLAKQRPTACPAS